MMINPIILALVCLTCHVALGFEHVHHVQLNKMHLLYSDENHYAISFATKGDHIWKTVSVNDGEAAIVNPMCDRTTKPLTSLSEQEVRYYRKTMTGLKEMATVIDDILFSEYFEHMADEVKGKYFMSAIYDDQANILERKEINSELRIIRVKEEELGLLEGPLGQENGLMVLNEDVVALINPDGSIQMKQIGCLDTEKQWFKLNDFTEATKEKKRDPDQKGRVLTLDFDIDSEPPEEPDQEIEPHELAPVPSPVSTKGLDRAEFPGSFSKKGKRVLFKPQTSMDGGELDTFGVPLNEDPLDTIDILFTPVPPDSVTIEDESQIWSRLHRLARQQYDHRNYDLSHESELLLEARFADASKCTVERFRQWNEWLSNDNYMSPTSNLRSYLLSHAKKQFTLCAEVLQQSIKLHPQRLTTTDMDQINSFMNQIPEQLVQHQLGAHLDLRESLPKQFLYGALVHYVSFKDMDIQRQLKKQKQKSKSGAKYVFASVLEKGLVAICEKIHSAMSDDLNLYELLLRNESTDVGHVNLDDLTTEWLNMAKVCRTITQQPLDYDRILSAYEANEASGKTGIKGLFK